MQIQGELQKKNCSLISIELQNTLVLLLQSLCFFWSEMFSN